MLVAILISLSLFYYFNQKNSIRRDEQKERLKEKREEYLRKLLESKKKAEQKDE